MERTADVSFASESRAQTVPRTLLVGLRVYLGVVFLLAVVPKLAAPAPGWPARLQALLEGGWLQRGHPFYQSFLRAVVLPRAPLFGTLIMTAELGVALSLITGTATRLGAGVAAFLVTNYMFSKGAWWWFPSSNDAAFFAIALILIAGAAGRAFGVDYFLARRCPNVPLW
jgi:uncharacterized membrane protein YphA (DoxX/SURF4 family)